MLDCAGVSKRSVVRAIGLALSLVLPAVSAAAQDSDVGFARDERRSATLRAVRLSEPLRLDGRLDEAIYAATAPIVEFFQTYPIENGVPSERTQAWVFFDADHIYVSARLWESVPPSKWTA